MSFARIAPGLSTLSLLALLGGCDMFHSPNNMLASGEDAAGETLCCDANDNCSPAPPPPGVCPADTITTVCDDDNNCVDEDLE